MKLRPRNALQRALWRDYEDWLLRRYVYGLTTCVEQRRIEDDLRLNFDYTLAELRTLQKQRSGDISRVGVVLYGLD
jgi:hypothetical protein